jgi:hypothetical protein
MPDKPASFCVTCGQWLSDPVAEGHEGHDIQLKTWSLPKGGTRVASA